MDRAPREHTNSHDELDETRSPERVTPADDGWGDWEDPGDDAPIFGGAGLMLTVLVMVLAVLLAMQMTGLS